MFYQIRFMKAKDLGYDKEHLLYIPLRGDTKQTYDVLKHELLKGEQVVNVTGTEHTPTHISSNSSGADWDGKDPDYTVLISFNAVDFDYVETIFRETAKKLNC
jgi:putative ABC transport system permease protein